MGWSWPWGGHCVVTGRSESGWIYSLIQVLVMENFGSLWEERSFPLGLGESLGLASPKSPLAGGESQGRCFGRRFRCAQAGLGFSFWEFPAEHLPFPNFLIQQNIGWKWGWIVNSQAGIPQNSQDFSAGVLRWQQEG